LPAANPVGIARADRDGCAGGPDEVREDEVRHNELDGGEDDDGDCLAGTVRPAGTTRDFCWSGGDRVYDAGW
jgi:hypothetical protein